MILFHTLLFAASLVNAQLNQDSLQRVIQSNRPYHDRMNAHLELLQSLETRNFEATIEEGEKALAHARKNKDSVAVAQVKRHMGVARYFLGEYDVAARLYFDAIEILEKSGRPDKLAPVYNELAKLYRKTRNLEKASETYGKAETIYRQLRDTGGISMILNESGVVYEYKSDYREALNRYTASLNLSQARGDSLGVSYALSNIAGVNVIEKKYDSAEKNLLRALRIRQQLKDSFAIALTYSDLGAAMNQKGDFARAIDYLEKSNIIAIRMNYPELQSNNYSELAEAAQQMGDFQKAYDYFLQKSYLRDSIFALEKSKQIEELRAEYESAEKEERIRQQEEKLRLQKFIMIGIGGVILLTGLLVHAQYKKNKLRQEARMKTQLMTQQENATKAVIQAEENERQRIARDLHDGVGQMMSAAKMNLSAFESDFGFENEEQKKTFNKIIQLVDESCREVRTVSHIMMPNALLRNSLASAIREFADKIRDPRVNIHVYTRGLEQRLDPSMETVLYRVVQECVTNAIRHAGATTLDISLIREQDEITGTIEDNGRGFDPATLEKNEGIGLKNIRSRIGYLKGTVDFDSMPGRGTVVAFHVPLPESLRAES
jgi:signal transduction histidine kinase